MTIPQVLTVMEMWWKRVRKCKTISVYTKSKVNLFSINIL